MNMPPKILPPKKIVLNATNASRAPTGLQVMTEEITARILKKTGDELIVFSASSRIIEMAGPRARKVSRLVSPRLGFRGNLARMAHCQTILPARSAIESARLFYSTVPEAPLFGPFKKIITGHDVIPYIFPEHAPRQSLYFKYFLPLLIKSCEALVFVSENTRRDFDRIYGLGDKPTFVVPNGVNHEKFKPAPGGDAPRKYGLDKYFLCLGDMRPYKNVGRAVEAFKMAGLSDHVLAIVGNKDDRFYPEVAARVRSLGMEKKVVFTGYAPDADLPGLYSSARAFVFPSLYEGFGLPPLEAMACGCPVISSDKTSIPEVLGDAALYFEGEDPADMARAMIEVSRGPELRARLSASGLERSAGFTWDRAADKVLAALREVCPEAFP